MVGHVDGTAIGRNPGRVLPWGEAGSVKRIILAQLMIFTTSAKADSMAKGWGTVQQWGGSWPRVKYGQAAEFRSALPVTLRDHDWIANFMNGRVLMSRCSVHLLALLICVTAFGCHVNPNYCEGRNANNNCTEPGDGGFDAPQACQNNSGCSAPTGVCDLSGGAATGKCVQCTVGDSAACIGLTPICGTDHVCRKCIAHSDCKATNVCLPSGECSNGTDTAYVEEKKNGTQCTQADPCPTITAALGKKPYIKVTGTIVDNFSIVGAPSTTILASLDATLVASGDVAINVLGTSELNIYDLAITNSFQNGIGISMPAVNHSTVSLYRAKLTNSKGGGIVASGGTLNITQSTISSNPGGGVKADGGGTLNITRSEISKNETGGIIMNSATTFKIVNNFIVGNGTDTGFNPSDVGGIQVKPGPGSILEFNTIVGNKSAAGSQAGGVYCSQVNAKFSVPNNLIFGNSGGGGGIAGLQISPQCTQANSLVIDPGAKFKSSSDYHLAVGNPDAILNGADAADCAANPEDYDGDSRPKAGQCALGADEYHP